MDETDANVEQMLTTYGSITVVGASGDPLKAAHGVPLHMQRHGWRIVPVNPRLAGTELFGEPVFATLADVAAAGIPVGLVDVFRPSEQTPDIARQAVAAGATALWLQLGIFSPQTRHIAADAGLLYVEDRCLIIEQSRLGVQSPASR